MSYRKLALAAAILILTPAFAAVAQEPATQETDTRILLRAVPPFDPLEDPPEMATALRLPAPEATERWIVQFQRPLTREERAMLTEEYGLALTDYVPNLAYVERLPPSALERVRQLDLVRATVAYQPAFKVSPDIGGKRFRTEERRAMPGLLLRAVLFGDADPQAVAAELAAIEGVSAVEVLEFGELGAPARIEFQLPSRAGLAAVARLEGVRWIEEVAEQDEDNGNTAGTMQSGTPGDEPVWDRGIHSEGQIIGVIDSGPVDIDHCMFEDPVDNTPSATHRKVLQVRTGGAADNGHATFVAGIALGDDFNLPGTAANRGNAWGARLVSGRRAEGILNALLANRAQGATIHTNSWHDNTDGAGMPALYNATAADADRFAWALEDHLVLGSMGNNGEEQGPPGTSKNSIGINAALRDPNENTVGDGNPGPTADGRRKPDFVTPGCQIRSAQVSTACTIQLRGCATSWATPAAAAAAALVRQYYAEGWYPTGTPQPAHVFDPTGSLVKATLANATLDMTGHAGYPSTTEGWGILRLDETLTFPGGTRALRAWDVRHADGLSSGEFEAFSINVASAAEPLKVTLVWADPPGLAGALNPVVNNLDLTVIAPGGATFRGNVFAGGQSVTGGAPDLLNNVEQVLVPAPAIGTWTLRVGAPAVNVGLPAQGFAVVASAAVSAPEIQVPGGVLLADTCVGENADATLEVCNTGDGDLIVSSIASTNPRFAITTPSSGFPVTVGPDVCFPFEVTFDPLATGAQTATLTVASNDPETPLVAVTAGGAGTQRDVLAGGSTEFGITSAWSPAERAVEVCNVGGCPLDVSSAAVSCPDFTLVSDPLPATLGPGSCATLVVGFTPVLPGAKSCTLTINSNDPDTPAVVLPLRARTPPALSLHAGVADAHGSFSTVARDGSTFNLDFLYPVSPNLAWQARLGVARLDGQPGFADTDVWKLGANARWTFNPGAPLRVFVDGGPHLYHFDPGSVEGGANLGLGLGVPAGARFSFELIWDYHWALTASPNLEFSELQLGTLVSF